MPQMAPMMWSYLFIMFSMMILILSSKIFFQTSLNLNFNLNSVMYTNKKPWKL